MPKANISPEQNARMRCVYMRPLTLNADDASTVVDDGPTDGPPSSCHGTALLQAGGAGYRPGQMVGRFVIEATDKQHKGKKRQCKWCLRFSNEDNRLYLVVSLLKLKLKLPTTKHICWRKYDEGCPSGKECAVCLWYAGLCMKAKGGMAYLSVVAEGGAELLAQAGARYMPALDDDLKDFVVGPFSADSFRRLGLLRSEMRRRNW